MRTTLNITPTPFRPSHLSLPPSPFSPQLPITPAPQPQTTKPPKTNPIPLTLPPPPPTPLFWLWQCHLCSRVYHLGTTRRCLDDGHFFCAGAPVTKRDRRTGVVTTRKSRACASEFDYAGWKAWGSWRRDVEAQREVAQALLEFGQGEGEVSRVENVADVPRPLFFARKAVLQGGVVGTAEEKDCWNTCDYPSECRWGRQFGQQQQQHQQTAVVLPSTPPPPPPPASLVNEPAPQDLSQPSKTFSSSLPSTIEEVTEPELEINSPSHLSSTSLQQAQQQETTLKPSIDDLLASAKRRKRRSAGPLLHSPLASNPVSPTEQKETSGQTLQRAFDDFEVDVRKSIGRAGVLLGGFVSGLNGAGAKEKEKETGHGRKKSMGKEEGQSLSD